MTTIWLDASGWKEPDDLFRDLLKALGAPAWHGRNLDALWDGLISGLYAFSPPLSVKITNSAGSPLDGSGLLARVASLFAEAQAEYGTGYAFELK